MQDDAANIYAILAFGAWELARWQEVVDWAVGLLGACTLIAMNVVRIRKALMNKQPVDKSSGKD